MSLDTSVAIFSVQEFAHQQLSRLQRRLTVVLEGLGKRGKQSFAKKVEQDLASLTSYQIKKEMRKPLLKQNWKEQMTAWAM